ncbi:MAG TPA: rhodanese-like domain-containing protein [Stellaceae bacterium]|nr:rhodanese-like domain-containing protein [Stellaceae bacterium]
MPETQMNPGGAADARAAAVDETVEAIRAIERDSGVTPAALERISERLIALATQTELFPPSSFGVPPGAPGKAYRLAEDADHRFALYASAGTNGRAAPPHNHTTWAVIAGVYGQEHNVFYRRTDDRSVPGQGSLEKTHELTVVKGNACKLMPDDFHTIETRGNGLHLHMYGMSLEHLPGRITFARESGGPYFVYPPTAGIAAPRVSAAEVHAMLRDGSEMAVLDVREEGVFSEEGHLFFANCMPLSRLELMVRDLVPRRLTRIVVYDGGEGLADRGATKLQLMGYRNVLVMEGGAAAWAAAGYELFTGVNVPSKAFGELVEHRCGTPHIAASELKRRLDAGEKVLIVDSRPIGEFRNMSIPGAFDCPGAELVYRVPDRVPSPDTLVVVNCAGRTRSIIGAQSLRNAGLPNPVMALENGTMGWEMAGLDLARGREESLPPPSPDGLARARALAEKVAERFSIPRIDDVGLARLKGEAAQRTLYLLDVRNPEEYAAGHLAGSRSAPGGQLVQATDAYMATRNARVVLIDDDGVRAVMTASWLVQMGWPEVFVLDRGLAGRPLVHGVEKTAIPELERATVPLVAPAALKEMLDRGEAAVVDLAPSLSYEAGHIPGAWFAVRARLPGNLAAVPRRKVLVLTSPDGAVARLAAAELALPDFSDIRVLDGGTEAWRAAGLSLTGGREAMADEPNDCWRRPYDPYARPDARERYLRWEIDLIRQIEREGDTGFRVPG